MRASKRPLCVLCPSADLPTEYTISVAKEASEVGTICHRGVAHAIAKTTPIEGTLADQCSVVGADLNEVEGLVDRAMRYWDAAYETGIVRTNMLVEQPYTHEGALGGTPDVRWLQPGDPMSAWVIDWKFGREARDCYHQLAQYACDMRDELRIAGKWDEEMTITTIARWVRLGQEERRVFTSHELDCWLLYVLDRESSAGKEYNPGDHCGFCPHAQSCEPRLSWSRSAVQSLAVVDEAALSDPQLLGRVYDQAKAVRRALAAYDKALGAILDNGGTVPLGNGKALVRSFQERDQIDLRAAMPVLRDAGITASELSQIASVAKGKLGDVIKAKAPRGQKTALWDEFLGRLRDAKAVGTKVVRTTNVIDARTEPQL